MLRSSFSRVLAWCVGTPAITSTPSTGPMAEQLSSTDRVGTAQQAGNAAQVLNQLSLSIQKRFAEDEAMKAAVLGAPSSFPSHPAANQIVVTGGVPEVKRVFIPRHRFLRVIDPSLPLDPEEELAANRDTP
jgi:hypothetical protein